MTRPRCSSRTPGFVVVERHRGWLRKRAPRLSRSCAVHPWLGLRHLRFAAPAPAPLHDSYGGAFGRAPRPRPCRKRRRRGLRQSGHAPCSGSAEATTLSERRSAWAARAAVANLRCLKPKHLPQAYVLPNLRTGLPRPPEQPTPIAVSHAGLRVGAGA